MRILLNIFQKADLKVHLVKLRHVLILAKGRMKYKKHLTTLSQPEISKSPNEEKSGRLLQ